MLAKYAKVESGLTFSTDELDYLESCKDHICINCGSKLEEVFGDVLVREFECNSCNKTFLLWKNQLNFFSAR